MVWIEKEFEEKMQPHINDIYFKYFSNLVEIKRSDRDGKNSDKLLFMDKELAIDTHLLFKDGTILTAQEKTRKEFYKQYQDFTFEYMNDPKKEEGGEWFKLAAQIYFYGYANKGKTGYLQFWILNVPKLRIYLKNKIGINTLKEKYLRKNKPPAKANFFAIPFNILIDDLYLIKDGCPIT